MQIHNEHNVFNQIKTMLQSQLDGNKRFDNTVIILGYNVVKGGFKTIKKLYPTQKIITLQLEQLFKGSNWVNKGNIEFLQKSDQVWDYDESNIRFLYENFNIKPIFFPLLYSAKLTNLKLLDIADHDIDILFYGSVNPKRKYIIDSLKELLPDKNIIVSEELWGDELDDHIQRSKIVLNLHYFNINRQEQARIFYLLSNHKCVVSEKSTYNYYNKGIVEGSPDDIASICKKLLQYDKWYLYAKESLKTLILSNLKYNQTGL